MRALALVAIAVTGVALLADGPARGQGAASCIKSWPEVRYGALAYNHIVHVANGCDPDAVCTVSTDVNPQAQEVVVAGHSEVAVMTFMGSPARAFKPNVKCTMQK
jgi:hypothetical protein